MRDDRIGVRLFTVLDAGQTVDADGRRLPTVVIDADDAPEVADLARVHAIEGVGDIRTEAVRVDDVIVLGIRMTAPVRAAFALAIDVQRFRALLDDVVERGCLVIAHTDPQLAGVEQPTWLAVDIDGPALAVHVAGRDDDAGT